MNTKTTSLTAAETQAIEAMLEAKRAADAATAAYNEHREALQEMMTRANDEAFRYDADDFKVCISNVIPQDKIVVDEDALFDRVRRRSTVSVEELFTPITTWELNTDALDEMRRNGKMKPNQVPMRTIPAKAPYVAVRITAVGK